MLQRCAHLEQTESRLKVCGRDDGNEEPARLDARHHARLAALFPAHLVEPDVQWLERMVHVHQERIAAIVLLVRSKYFA
eukprot:scaffold2406_cov57-Phaeocystis_antarctica.AAC.4